MERDFTKYTLEELYEIRDTIDRYEYPERLEQVLKLIEERKQFGDPILKENIEQAKPGQTREEFIEEIRRKGPLKTPFPEFYYDIKPVLKDSLAILSEQEEQEFEDELIIWADAQSKSYKAYSSIFERFFTLLITIGLLTSTYFYIKPTDLWITEHYAEALSFFVESDMSINLDTIKEFAFNAFTILFPLLWIYAIIRTIFFTLFSKLRLDVIYIVTNNRVIEFDKANQCIIKQYLPSDMNILKQEEIILFTDLISVLIHARSEGEGTQHYGIRGVRVDSDLIEILDTLFFKDKPVSPVLSKAGEILDVLNEKILGYK